MLISDHLTYEVTINKTQLEEMLEKQGVDEGRILENCRVKVKTIDYDPNKEILSIDIQVLQQQDG